MDSNRPKTVVQASALRSDFGQLEEPDRELVQNDGGNQVLVRIVLIQGLQHPTYKHVDWM